ncbi:hypothetical protein EA004_29100 [Vibrio anguillarum]|uniref:Uncharacterized protein n=1 Tax=Vibrio anguillarum TaxID=55601 RepID=A0ABR9ZBN6_VIBAN|nr:hypothetical protein [Vibrio anguillarum]MBF4248985.1 hypothetical protein [Vibrio anguillarum]MBF4254027.1 hypothetical protein [Vibrio anguillarum]MBF4375878.1 hypothetical protein [Vibrio anguillarum]
MIRNVQFDTYGNGLSTGTIRVGSELCYVGFFVFDECRYMGGDTTMFFMGGKVTFVGDASLFNLYSQFRKQDEAPEMGADSSLKLCDGCKNTFASNQEECPDCKQYANVAPIRGVRS